jgi:uncharacterized protein
MATASAEGSRDRLTGRAAVSSQVWRDVVFLHWPCEPAAVAGLMPPGTQPDLLDESAWLGLVALRMTKVRVAGLPGLGSFPEINLRLYTVDGQGRHGVAFVAMEVSRLIFAAGTRLIAGLPCNWSRMEQLSTGGGVTYRSSRRFPAPVGVGLSCQVQPQADITAGPLEQFVTERSGLHLTVGGRLLFLPVSHEPWRLCRARLADFTEGGLFASAGLPEPRAEPASVLYAPYAHARARLPIRAASHV